MDREAALIEAILFLESDPVDLGKLTKISMLNKEAVEASLEVLRTKYARDDSGLEIAETTGAFSLIVKSSLTESLKVHYGKKLDDKMSKAALETLAIVAYSQPMTRSEIESIRGVSCSAVIKLLLGKELIHEMGRKEAPGRPVQYGTTKKFLHTFGLSSISDLPKLDGAERDRFELKES